MRIGGVGARPPTAPDVATALSGAAATLGQRPAITSLSSEGRHEQGFVSLAGWAAKGANLLRDEFGLAAGDRLGIAGPPGWPLAAVTLAAWWLGVIVVPAATPGLPLRVLHTGTPTGAARSDVGRAGDGADLGTGGGTVLWIGDAMDGSGSPPAPGDECWTDAVIPYPDRAPTPARDGAGLALDLTDDPASATQLELLRGLAADPGGTVGIVRHGDADLFARPDAALLIATLVLRPLVTGAATVVASAGGGGDVVATTGTTGTTWSGSPRRSASSAG
jgi:hypothetical protein